MTGLGILAPRLVDVRMGVPDLRWGLFAIGLAWALLAWRGRRLPTLAGGVLFVTAVLGFWTSTFGRPYGLADATPACREAAFAVRAAQAPPLEGFVAGRPFEGGRWARLAGQGLPLELLLAAPTWLPLFVFPASGLLIAGLWRSPSALWGAVLWLAFSTTDLEALRGGGFADGLWAHPAGSLAFLAAASGALLLGRGGAGGWLGAGALGLGAWLAWPAGPAAGAAPLWQVLLVNSWPWPVLALLGARLAADRASRWCLGLGLAGCLGSAFGLPIDDWAARGLWRLGLVLAAAPAVRQLCGELARRLWPARLPTALGAPLALVLALALPGSFLAWWSPYQLDPAAEASFPRVPPALERTARWLDRELPAQAVVVASPAYAPAVAVLGRRRVLRAPGLAEVPDDLRRNRLERMLVEGAPGGQQNALRYGITHVLVGTGDAQRWNLAAPTSPHWPKRLRRLATPAPGFSVYVLEGW